MKYVNIPETTIMAGNYRMILSSEGAWIDELNDDGTVKKSSAAAWEEMAEHEVESYLSLYYETMGKPESATLSMTG